MNIRVEKPTAWNLLKPLAIVLLIGIALVLGSRFVPHPYVSLAFEVLGFEGDVQIYDLQTHSWRTPKRGEDFVATQKIRTGKDGMINLQVENEIHLRLKENSEVQNEESRVTGKREIYKLRLTRGVLLGATTRQFEHLQKDNKAVLKILTRDYVANIHGAIFRVQASEQQGQANIGVLRGFVEVSAPSPFSFSSGVRIRGLEETRVVGGVIQPATRVTAEAWSLMKESYELLGKTAAMEAEQIDLSKMAGSFFDVVFDHGSFFTPQMGYAGREFFKDPDSGQIYFETEYDVFPTGSFAGIYFKTRNFDISKYAGFSFEVRRKSDEGVPDSFFIELKSKGNVVRRYAPRNFEATWKTSQFDFRAQKPLSVNEVVFVFTNARVGEAKKGVLEFRNFQLIPLPPPAAPAVQAGASASMLSPAPVETNQAKPALVASQKVAPVANSSVPDSKKVSPQ